MRFRRKDGATLWGLVASSVLPDEGGAFMGTLRMVTDVTARRQAEDRLAESEARYRSLAEAMPQMVWTAGPDGAIDYVNQRWVDFSGLTFDESLGRGYAAVVHPGDLPAVREAWDRAIATGGDYEMQMRQRRGVDGAYRWMLSQAHPCAMRAARS